MAQTFVFNCIFIFRYCKGVRHIVMENLQDIKQVTSEPDIRLFKCGLDHEFSKVMVSVVQVNIYIATVG